MHTYNVDPPKQPCILNQSELILFWLRFENYNFQSQMDFFTNKIHTPRLVPPVPSFVWDTAETSYFHRGRSSSFRRQEGLSSLRLVAMSSLATNWTAQQVGLIILFKDIIAHIFFPNLYYI